MKNIWFTVLLILVFSCDRKEDLCEPPAIQKNLIGSWTAILTSYEKLVSTVVFNEDGSYTESKGVLFSNFNNPVISWNAKKDSVNITAKYSDSKTSTYSFSVSKNLCDTIILNLETFDQLKLVRK